jgi:hypothetical protein
MAREFDYLQPNEPRWGRLNPVDPSVDTFRQRFAPFSSDPVGDYIEEQQRQPPPRIAPPGTRERFGDPSKVLSMAGGGTPKSDTEQPYAVPKGFQFDEAPPSAVPKGFVFDEPVEPKAAPPAKPSPLAGVTLSADPAEQAREVAAIATSRATRGRTEGPVTDAITNLIPEWVAGAKKGFGQFLKSAGGELQEPQNAMAAALGGPVAPGIAAMRGGAALTRALSEGGFQGVDQAATGKTVQGAISSATAPEAITGAAIKYRDKIYRGAIHSDAAENAAHETGAASRDVIYESRPGFITTTGRFVDRDEATKIAAKTGQLEEGQTKLFGEDLFASDLNRTTNTGPGTQRLSTISDLRSPEDAIGRIANLARTSGPEDLKALAQLRKVIPADKHAEVQAALVNKLGQGDTGEFSAGTFIRNYGAVSDRAKNILFGQGGGGSLRQHLDSIAEVTERTPTWRGPSMRTMAGTATAASAVGGLTGIGAVAAPLAVLGTMIPVKVVAHALTSPALAASVAAWSRAYERVVRSGGNAAIVGFNLATKNLNNNLGTDVDPATVIGGARGKPVE